MSRLHLLQTKIRFLPMLPLIGNLYRRYRQNKDLMRAMVMKSELQQQLMINVFGKCVAGVAFETYNGFLVNGLSDINVSKDLGFTGAYDKAKIEYILPLIDPGSCVYILGAHIGTLAVPIARSAREVIAFEANPATFQFLSRNIDLNQARNVKSYNFAVYDKEIQLPFYQSRTNTGGSKIKPVKDHLWYNYDDPEIIHVSGKVLDEFVIGTGLPMPDLIIMDIEGAEHAALKGARACLRNASHLYIEFVPHHLSNVANVSVDDFAATITAEFSKMVVVDDEVEARRRPYCGAEIVQTLRAFGKAGRGCDLLFSK
ncbi:FkbM family methyltransferase [Puia sp.]|uniref:FkbM family methyltransferase n=1 Tax=Puia sp. TaxID=2045100 RepID=UPI002F3EF3BF